jgi:hypothetical protein
VGLACEPSLKHPIESKPIKVKELLVEDFAQLMQRLLEIQSGGRQESPELVAEDERLIDAIQKRVLARKPRQPMLKPGC